MQFSNGQATRPTLTHRCQRLVQQPVKIVEGHSGQRANIHMQFATGANAVGGIAAVNGPKVKCGIRDGKCGVVITLFQVIAQLHDAADGIVH